MTGSKLMKVFIKCPGPTCNGTKVLIDGTEIRGLTDVQVRFLPNSLPSVRLELLPNEIYIDAGTEAKAIEISNLSIKELGKPAAGLGARIGAAFLGQLRNMNSDVAIAFAEFAFLVAMVAVVVGGRA